MQFYDIPGSAVEKNQLKELYLRDKVPHALMFLGSDGTAKLALALAFAQYLQCENTGGEDSCGTCDQCRKTSKLMHPDVHFSFPFISENRETVSDQFLDKWRKMILTHPYFGVYDWLEKVGPSRKQGNISVGECLNIIRKLGLKAFEGRFKIMILWMPEYLQKDGNRLLKILEEPPPSTVLILVAENASQILPTIRSRCQMMRISGPSKAEVVAFLSRRGYEMKHAKTIAYHVNGNFREALQLAGSEERDFIRDFLEWLKICYKGQMEAVFEFGDEMAKRNREEIKQFLHYGLKFLQMTNGYKINGSTTEIFSDQEEQAVRWLSSKVEFEELEFLIQQLNDRFRQIQHNANERLLFFNLSVQFRNALSGQVKKNPWSQYISI